MTIHQPSDQDPILLNMPVDIEEASKAVRKIVNKANKDGSLSDLTPRVVRQRAEVELGLDPGTLDEKAYKDKLKTIIQDAVDAAGPVDDSESDKQEGSSKGKETPSPPKAKTKATEKKPKVRKSTDGTDSDLQKKRKKVVQTAKSPPPVKSNSSNSVPSSEKKPDIVKLTGETVKYQSDSEMSVLIDEPPPKKRKKRASDEAPKETKPKAKAQAKEAPSANDEKIKKLKSLVLACGVRKVWAKELKDCETPSQQISHLRRMLTDLGMKGRFSVEQARTIRQQRELAQEIQDVREFAAKHAGEGRASRSAAQEKSKSKQDTDSDDDDEDGSDNSDGEQEKVRRPKVNAHRSIMAFLGDQSDSD